MDLAVTCLGGIVSVAKESQRKEYVILISRLVKDSAASLCYVQDGNIPLPPEALPLCVKRVADWTVGL